MHRRRRSDRPWIESCEARRLLAVVTVTGTANNDFVIVSVSGLNLLVTLNGAPTSYPLATTDSLVINAGAGADAVEIASSPVDVTINGEAGNDTVTLAPAGKNLNTITGSVRFNGGPDVDAYVLRDDNSGTVGRNYGFGATEPNDVFRIGTGFHSHSGVESFDLYAGPGDDLFDFTNSFSGTTFTLHGNGGADTFDIYSTPGTSKVIADGGPGDDVVRARPTVTQTSVVEIAASDQVGFLNVTANGTVRLTNHSAVRVANSWTNAGTIDIGDGTLITANGVTNFDELAFQEQLYQGTLGNKPRVISGIAAASSAADGVGLGDGADIKITTAGPFTIGAVDAVLRYTTAGDFDLSGNTNFDDLLRLASNYNSLTDMFFIQGDANYDGGVNFDDLLLLASAYNTSVPAAAPAPIVASGNDQTDDAPNDVLL
jgi:hypothetical protein